MKRTRNLTGLVVLALVLGAGQAAAQDGNVEIGLQLNALGGSGKPTNDILGYGASVRYGFSDKWWLGVGLDRSDVFDVERPIEFFGLEGDPAAGEIDPKGESTMVRLWLERVSRSERKVELFWGVGVGINFVDVETVEGPIDGGGTYRIATSVDDELILEGLAGLRWKFGAGWVFTATLRADQHLGDWNLVDHVSGDTTIIDDHFVRGVTLGLGYRF